MKKLISLILILATMLTTFAIPPYAAQPGEISPQYITSKNAQTYLSIDSNGQVSISVIFNGTSDVSEASVTTYLERKIGSTWYRARVNPWTYSESDTSFLTVFSGHVTDSGTYRARSTFTVNGSTVETITVISECTYWPLCILISHPVWERNNQTTKGGYSVIQTKIQSQEVNDQFQTNRILPTPGIQINSGKQ